MSDRMGNANIQGSEDDGNDDDIYDSDEDNEDDDLWSLEPGGWAGATVILQA
jgi:hypothetical protein